MKRRASLAIPLIAGLAAAIVLTLPSVARAWDINALPGGFSAASFPAGGSCVRWEIRGYNAAASITDCSDDATHADFQARLDAFIEANCPVDVCHPTPPTTATTVPPTSTGASTTPTPTTTVVQTVTTTTPQPTASTPTASFTSAATGLVVTFTDTATAVSPATISTVTWHFGDGANGVGAQASHTYTTSGNFTIIEIVTDSNGLASQASEQITVSAFGEHADYAQTLSTPIGLAASRTFGQELAVYCVSSWGQTTPERGYGLSLVGSHQVAIWSAGCKALTTKRGPVALALLVLGHESAHALGIRSEKTADCLSLRRVPALEKTLGIADRGEQAWARKYVAARWGRC